MRKQKCNCFTQVHQSSIASYYKFIPVLLHFWRESCKWMFLLNSSHSLKVLGLKGRENFWQCHSQGCTLLIGNLGIDKLVGKYCDTSTAQKIAILLHVQTSFSVRCWKCCNCLCSVSYSNWSFIFFCFQLLNETGFTLNLNKSAFCQKLVSIRNQKFYIY